LGEKWIGLLGYVLGDFSASLSGHPGFGSLSAIQKSLNAFSFVFVRLVVYVKKKTVDENESENGERHQINYFLKSFFIN
jgi:hypothetical protein